MTEEALLATIQQKEQEKIENMLEEKKAYRACLLKCVEKRSSFKRGVYFYTHYVGLISTLCFLFVLYFLLGFFAFLVIKNSFQELVDLSLGALSIMVSGFAFLSATIVLLRSECPSFGFSDKGIYEEIQWINREIKGLEKQKGKQENEE